jgi:hypothetical protein
VKPWIDTTNHVIGGNLINKRGRRSFRFERRGIYRKFHQVKASTGRDLYPVPGIIVAVII